MINSMTGFGYSEIRINKTRFFFTIKSVNSKFLEININIPVEFQHLEEQISKVIKIYFIRGKLDVYVGIDRTTLQTKLELNQNLFEEYLFLINKINKKFKSKQEVSIGDIINFNGMVSARQSHKNIKFDRDLKKTFLKGLNNLKSMRQAEGKGIQKNLLKILSNMDTYINQVKVKLPKVIKNYKKRLKNKIEELVGKKSYDENRILIEVALLADKVDINEEVQRMKSHIFQMKKYINGSKPCGKLMEFLLQEMLRETNTIGSKVSDIDVTKNIILLKESIDQLREQARNVE